MLPEWKLLWRPASETRDTDLLKQGAINCTTPPTVEHRESPEQMRESTKSHDPSGKEKEGVPALHQCRMHSSATIMTTKPSVSLRHHCAHQRWQLTQICILFFTFIKSRVVSKMITTQNSWKMRLLALQELCHCDRINLKVASFTHLSS